MPSIRDNFDELMERVRSGRELGHASFEPIYYLIFHPKEILDVKRSLPAWIAKLRNENHPSSGIKPINLWPMPLQMAR